MSLETDNRLNEKWGTHKTLCKNKESERHTVPMCVAGTVVPLGRLMDALIGLSVEWYKSGEQIIWSVAPISRSQYEVEFGLEVTELQEKKLVCVGWTLPENERWWLG